LAKGGNFNTSVIFLALSEYDIVNQEEMLAALERIKQLIPEDVDVSEIKEVKCMSATQHFILQEVKAFNILLAAVRNSLTSLENVR